MLEYIKGQDDLLLAIIIRQGFSDKGVNFVTSPENFLQVGILNHKGGSKLKPHRHKEKPRTINYTQKVLHLEYGKVEAVFYQNGQLIKKCLLFEGDTIILLGGGHGFNILENTKMIEIKQGSYLSQAEDKEWLEIKAGAGNFDHFYSLIDDQNYIHFENRFIPDEEVPDFFSRASIVVIPYTDGSQSGIISIAASFKKPVVATDVGNFSEMIINGKTGLLVPPKDPQALADAMEKLLTDDNLRHEMGENAYKFMNENFSWEKIAQQTYQVYQEAVANWQAQRNQKKKRYDGK